MKTSIQFIVAALLAGCAVGPEYKAPAASAPETWNEIAGDKVAQGSVELVAWWTSFGDPVLDSLIERARAANLDPKSAAARVREARVQAGRVRGERLPEVHASGSVTRERSGRSADFGESIEDRRDVLVSLLGDVAASYVDLRGNQRLATVVRRNIATASDTLELTRTRLRAGLATELDVVRAEALLARAESSLPQFDGAVRVAIHRLSVLLAESPGELTAELQQERERHTNAS